MVMDCAGGRVLESFGEVKGVAEGLLGIGGATVVGGIAGVMGDASVPL